MLLAELVLVALFVSLVVVLVWAARAALQAAPGPARLPSRRRAQLAAAVSQARWAAAHDEVDGATRILLRRGYTGLDGMPVVLEQRVFDTVRADETAWESRFTEAMSAARFRCAYLNAEESLG
ncbi:hypothetical protein SAMN04488085_10451 [Geodermatophilus ruber]|uniref:Uncharacterized protein n=2 Tax=Geodermatophilus ruber TaxID=504800 RepID=A0A1I4CXB6_9ACTN|nr:hypothetical protein SAMN04488085_10451 [Geodermatophilus ruber]